MRSAPLSLLVVLLLAVTAPAGAQQINGGYRLSGDAQARPVQAFDDGRQLFVQLRDPTSPPAPIGPGGPVAYTIRGHYLVMPILPFVQLRYGPYTAHVTAHGHPGQGGGVVSVNRPVEVNEGPLMVTPTPTVAPTVAVMPVTVVRPEPASVAAPRSGVSGEISASGPRGSITAEALPEPAAKPTPAPRGPQQLSITAAGEASSFAGLRGQRVTVRADGSSRGATAALTARRTCTAAGATCVIEYRGAPAGFLTLEVSR